MNVRSYGNMVGMLQVNAGSLGLGCSYQFGTRDSPLKRTINNNTHEIGLSYRFGD